jgi:hypothetical protein
VGLGTRAARLQLNNNRKGGRERERWREGKKKEASISSRNRGGEFEDCPALPFPSLPFPLAGKESVLVQLRNTSARASWPSVGCAEEDRTAVGPGGISNLVDVLYGITSRVIRLSLTACVLPLDQLPKTETTHCDKNTLH